MRIFGHKPSEIRKELVAAGVTLGALLTVVVLMLAAFPHTAAIVGMIGLSLRAGVDALQRADIARDIDQLDGG